MNQEFTDSKQQAAVMTIASLQIRKDVLQIVLDAKASAVEKAKNEMDEIAAEIRVIDSRIARIQYNNLPDIKPLKMEIV